MSLRREMAAYLLPPREEMPRRSLASWPVRWRRHQAYLARLGATLPGLLEELRAATHILSGSERERAF